MTSQIPYRPVSMWTQMFLYPEPYFIQPFQRDWYLPQTSPQAPSHFYCSGRRCLWHKRGKSQMRWFAQLPGAFRPVWGANGASRAEALQPP